MTRTSLARSLHAFYGLGWLARGVSLALLLRAPLAAQQSGVPLVRLADRGPTFYDVSGSRPMAVDASTVPALQRRIAIDLDDAPLPAAVNAVSRAAAIPIMYNAANLPANRRVTLAATKITVAAALTDVLLNVGLDVQLSDQGTLSLVPRSGATSLSLLQPSPRGVIEGIVIDADSRAPLSGATVRLVGGSQVTTTTTDPDGKYKFTHLARGSYRIGARRLGYVAQEQVATVDTTGAEAQRLDFALVASPAMLDQVVATASGPQRRIELGNAIATIEADSVVPTAPVTDLSELVSGRAPNVQVLPSSGVVGSGSRIRMRGLSSASLSNDPVIIVDGVRVDNALSGVNQATLDGGDKPETPSPLDNIDPGDIQSIDLLRGPSASTEYGTDAANGVIVIRTRRGQNGPPRLTLAGEQVSSSIPEHFADLYHTWGHDSTGAAVTCPLAQQAQHACVVDSLTHWNPLNHAATSLFGEGYRSKLDGSVSGGSSRATYFMSAGYTSDVGVLRLPNFDDPYLRISQDAPIASNQARPNAQTLVNLRARANARLGSAADVDVSTTYIASDQRSPGTYYLLSGVNYGPGYRDSLNGYYSFFRPGELLGETASQSTQRFIGAATANWRPLGWLSGRGTMGIDLDAGTQLATVPVGIPDLAHNFATAGYRGDVRGNTNVYSGDAVAIASLNAGRLSTRTAVGLQYADHRVNQSVLRATGLLPVGVSNATGAASASVLEPSNEAITLGSYAEETAGWDDRVYLTGAVRVDAGSGFGAAYQAALYPKASVSWAAFKTPGDLLRLRAAYGQSGVQPSRGASLSLFATQPAVIGGTATSGVLPQSLGNPNLKPERQTELEAGFDLGVFANRLGFEATFYQKRSTDALVNQNLAGSAGYLTVEENLGSVRNRGIEFSVVAQPFVSYALSWDVNLSGSWNQNVLESLGPSIPPVTGVGFASLIRQQPGFPVYGIWAQPVHYSDPDHDGVLTPSDVTVADSSTYVGSSIPTREYALNSGITLFGGRVRLSTQVDYRGGHSLINAQAASRTFFYTDRALNVRGSLNDQARDLGYLNTFTYNAGFVEHADFVRWRELSLTYVVPGSWARAFRAQGVTLTVSVRNLALWTRYSGPDPEVNTLGLNDSPADAAIDAGSVPQPRYFFARVNLNF